jgi:hypothetical protein
MSFAITTDQLRARTKFVTRRLGWNNLKAGELVQACVKCMGLKKGEKIERLAVIRIVDVRKEALNLMSANSTYGEEEARLEGFPHLTGEGFVEMFMDHNKCAPSTPVTRIQFEYA